MPRQTAGLRFDDRIAALPVGFLFRCQRTGHPEALHFERLKRDAVDARTNHDAEFHAGAHGSPAGGRLTVGEALDSLVRYVEELEAAGKRDAKTTKWYRDARARLLEGLIGSRLLSSITLLDCRGYALYRLRNGKTGGERVIRELEVLEKAARDNGIQLSWNSKQLVDEVRPTHRQKRLVPSDQLVAFIKALDEDAQDFAFTKLRTLLRNEELYDLRVKDVHLEERLLRFVKRAKRSRTNAVQVIPEDLVAVLARRVENKLPEAFVFTCRGRKVQQSSFRKACVRASKRAEIVPPITSLSLIRHNALTLLRAALGVDDAAAAAGHTTVRVVEQFYDLDAEKLAAKKRAAEALTTAFPR